MTRSFLTLAFTAWALLMVAMSSHAAAIDMVVVKKGERKLLLLSADEVVRQYRIALGANPKGHKQYSGDMRTPEGEYILDWRNPESRFHRSIRISYPNESDIAHAETLGKDPGGLIMIHGWPNNPAWPESRYRYYDWTEGCIAVTNEEMDEIWELVEEGTPIRILP
jgi:murein L,D-transpeptidase YafK